MWLGNRENGAGGIPGLIAYDHGIETIEIENVIGEGNAGHTLVFEKNAEDILFRITANSNSDKSLTFLYTEAFDFTPYRFVYVLFESLNDTTNEIDPALGYAAAPTAAPTYIQAPDPTSFNISTSVSFIVRTFTLGGDISGVSGMQRLHMGGDINRQSENPEFRVKQIILIK